MLIYYQVIPVWVVETTGESLENAQPLLTAGTEVRATCMTCYVTRLL
jgi:hypothetical protein